MLQTRYTGTDLVPAVPWGTHYCQFYDTGQDLLDQVVPYLKAGLERGESCVWVTCEPMTPSTARDALGNVVPDVDRFLARGQLHIAPHTDWYMKDGCFDQQRVLGGWLAFLEQALASGYEGLRLTGNIAWLEQSGWKDFETYEAAISSAIAGRKVLALCTYDLRRCGVNEILDVVKNHDFALIKRGTTWEVIQSQEHRALHDALHDTERRYEALFQHALTEEKRAQADRQRLYREAQEANQLKDDFLATLSHELRTPLNAILGWSQMLAAGMLDAATQRRAVDAIARNAQAQSRLVADILDVSRIITGKLRLALAEVDVLQVVDDALAAIRPAADAKRIALNCVSTFPGVRLVGDRDRLQQVLWNLLSNAVKFTPSGGAVTVEVYAVDSRIEVRVVDTGIGIAEAFLPRVFERFTQHDGTAARQHGGLGLGLAIARHLVELHGGSIRAESAGEHRGTTIIVQLPVRAVIPAEADEVRQPSANEPEAATAADLSRVRVLVADDDQDARQLIELTLTQAGAEVTLAGSGLEAIACAQRAAFDIVICDIGMPKMDGYQVIRSIRALGGWAATVPAIAFTAYGRLEDCTRALAAGFTRHLAKPVLPAQLVSTVFHLVSGSAT